MSRVCEVPGLSQVRRPGQFPDPLRDLVPDEASGRATSVLAGGCFWCTEAVFRQLEGVLDVESGYCGGTAGSANYDAVCSGETDHAEAIRISYDPRRVSYGKLLKVFFSAAHDPTQFNRQGNDRGRQYRSAIFYSDENEREVASGYIAQLEAEGVFTAPVVTTLEALHAFFPAETHHQDYAARNPAQPYIAAVSAPKVEKVRRQYAELVKPTSPEPEESA